MKIAFLLAWRSFRSRPGRAITATLGVALGIATVLSVSIIDHNTLLTQLRATGTSSWDASIRPIKPGLQEEAIFPPRLLSDGDIDEIFVEFYERVEMERKDSKSPLPARLQGIGFHPTSPGSEERYTVLSGRGLTSQDERAALISGRLSENENLRPGDLIRLGALVATRTGCIEGNTISIGPEAAPPSSLDFVVAGIFHESGRGRSRDLIAPIASSLSLFPQDRIQPTYRVRLKDSAVYQDLRERHKSNFIVEQRKASRTGERIDQKAFRKSLRITSALSLLLGLYVIYNSFSMALAERVREIGLLRAIGLSRNEIGGSVLLEGALLSFLGAILGLFLTVGLVLFMRYFHITTLGFGKPLKIHEIPFLLSGCIVFLGMVFALLGMIAPLLRARNLKVIDALKAGRLLLSSETGLRTRLIFLLGAPLLIPIFFFLVAPPLGDRQELVNEVILQMALVIGAFFALVLLLPRVIHGGLVFILTPFRRFFPVEAPLAQAAMRGSRQRSLATLTGLTIVVATVVTVRSVNLGFIHEMERFSKRALEGRVYLRSRDDIPLSFLQDQAKKISGIESVYSLSAEIPSPFPLRGVQVEDAVKELAILRDNPEKLARFRNGESLLLSSFLADSFGYAVGETITLPTFTGPRSLTVDGVIDEFGYYPDDRSFAILESDRMNELFCVTGEEGRQFVARLHPDAKRKPVVAALGKAFPKRTFSWIQSDHDLTHRYVLDRRRDFFIFDVILWMMSALAGVGLLNSVTIAMLERKREIGLLRTVGLYQHQIRRMLILESMSIGLLGGFLAAAVSIPLSFLALEGVRTISQLDLHLILEPRVVLFPVFISLAISVLSCLLPAFRRRRFDLSTLSRYE